MLLVGEPDLLLRNPFIPPIKNIVPINFTSIESNFPMLDVIPPFQCQEGFEQQFDMNYASFLLGDRFIQMMQLAFMLYDSVNVYLMVNHSNDILENISESFIKFIQSRYGINPVYINGVIDWQFVHEHQDNMSFSLNGLFNFDQDKERYSIIKMTEAKNNGNPLPEGQFY